MSHIRESRFRERVVFGEDPETKDPKSGRTSGT